MNYYRKKILCVFFCYHIKLAKIIELNKNLIIMGQHWRSQKHRETHRIEDN